jgi:hypothetical protein
MGSARLLWDDLTDSSSQVYNAVLGSPMGQRVPNFIRKPLKLLPQYLPGATD